MLSLLVCAMLGQFKEGDSVSVKPPGAHAWRTLPLASARYKDSGPGSGLFRYFQKREVLSVLVVEERDGEKFAKVRDTERDETWWMPVADLSLLDTEQRSRNKQDGLAEKLRPFCVTKPEHEALTIAVGKGLDPISMTAKDAAALSPSQRKALSAVKARHLRAKKK